MADIKLVIKIDEEYLEDIKERVKDGDIDYEPWVAIANGIPLPKGHGNMIDADAFIERMKDASKRQNYKDVLIDDCLTVDDVFNSIIASLQNKGLANGDAPVIIEADNESEAKE